MGTHDDQKPMEGENNSKNSFTTIDDLTRMARELFAGLKKLGESRHPLEIRRGIGKGVKDMTDQNDLSRTVKAGSKTYFFDIKKTKEGKSYLVITESRFKSEGQDRERNAIMVFPENGREFAETVSEMVDKLN